MSGIYEDLQPKFSLNNISEIKRSSKAHKHRATKKIRRGVVGEQAELVQNLPQQNVSQSKDGSQVPPIRCQSSVRKSHFKMKREPFDKNANRFLSETDLSLLPLSKRLRYFNNLCETQNFHSSNVPTYCPTVDHLVDTNISFNRKTTELKTLVSASKSMPPSGVKVDAVDCPHLIKESSRKDHKRIKLKPFSSPLIPEATKQTMDNCASTILKDFINLEAQYAPLMSRIQWEPCHTSKKQLIPSIKSNPSKRNRINFDKSYVNEVKTSLNDSTHQFRAQQGRETVNPYCPHKNLRDYNKVPGIRNMRSAKSSNDGNRKKTEDVSQEKNCVVPSLCKSKSCLNMGTVSRINDKKGTYYGFYVMREDKGTQTETSQFKKIQYKRSKAFNKKRHKESSSVTSTNVYSVFGNESEVINQKKKMNKIKQVQQYEKKQCSSVDKESSKLNVASPITVLKCTPHYEKVKKFEDIFISENEYLTALTDFDKLFSFKT